MLKLRDLSYNYENGATINYKNWEVASSSHALILGDSGSGKTTLLHLLGGIMPAKSGTIELNDNVYPTKNLDKWRGNNIGIVFQRPHLVSSLSIIENLNLAFSLVGNKVSTQRTESLMAALNLTDLKNQKPYQLSQGQAQRVSIARALINKPQLLLADEPTASLDDTNAQKVIELLKSQAKENEAMLIIATHDKRVKDEFENKMEL